MIPFDLAEPTSLSDAVKLLNPDDPTVRPMAGGTALMLMMKAGVFNPDKLVSLRKIEKKYSSIAAAADGLRIGAMTTLNTLERSDAVKKHAPLISRTLVTLSNVRVRNVATVGGALAHGDPMFKNMGFQYEKEAKSYRIQMQKLGWDGVWAETEERLRCGVLRRGVVSGLVAVKRPPKPTLAAESKTQ